MSSTAHKVLPPSFSAIEQFALKRYVERVSERSFRFAEPGVKSRFHRDSRMVLRILARRLDLPLGSYAIRSIMGAISEPGNITLQMSNASIQIQQTTRYRDIQFKIRRYGGTDNRMLLSSDTAPVASLLDVECLIVRIKKILSL